MKLTGPQIAAAISLAGMTREALCKEAAIAKSTLIDIIANKGSIREATLDKIRHVLELRSIEFLPGEGVRKKDRTIETYEGDEANRTLLDDVYETLRDDGGEVLISGVIEELAIKALDETFLKAHIERLNKAGIKERMLILKNDTNFTVPVECYRWVEEQYFSPHSMYIYGPKLALVWWAPNRKCVIIHDESFAESTRRLFNFVWDKSEVPDVKATKGMK